MHNEDLALRNLQSLICYETEPSQIFIYFDIYVLKRIQL